MFCINPYSALWNNCYFQFWLLTEHAGWGSQFSNYWFYLLFYVSFLLPLATVNKNSYLSHSLSWKSFRTRYLIQCVLTMMDFILLYIHSLQKEMPYIKDLLIEFFNIHVRAHTLWKKLRSLTFYFLLLCDRKIAFVLCYQHNVTERDRLQCSWMGRKSAVCWQYQWAFSNYLYNKGNLKRIFGQFYFNVCFKIYKFKSWCFI